MIQAKCIQKFRDKQGKIYGYRLQDINGQVQDVQPENLKTAIKNKQIHIVNLRLTTDNRLVDTTEKQLKCKELGKSPVIKKSKLDIIEDYIQSLKTKLSKAGLGTADLSTSDYSSYKPGDLIEFTLPDFSRLIDCSISNSKAKFTVNNSELTDIIYEINCKDVTDETLAKVYECIQKLMSEADIDSPKHKHIKISNGSIKDKRPYDSDSYDEFIESLITVIEKAFQFTASERFTEGDREIDETTREITWATGMMGDFIYEGQRCYLNLSFSYKPENYTGMLSLGVVEYFPTGGPLYEMKCNFSGKNMKANFSHMLKETQKFVYTVIDKWEH